MDHAERTDAERTDAERTDAGSGIAAGAVTRTTSTAGSSLPGRVDRPAPTDPRTCAVRHTVAGPADFEQWRHAVSSALVPLEPILRDDQPFRAALDVTLLGSLSLLSVRATPHDVVRTVRATRAAETGIYKIVFQVAGAGVLDQNGRRCVLRSGDIVLSDTTRPYRLGQRESFHLTALMFPREALPLPEAVVERFTGRVLPCRDGAGAVLHACMQSLQAHAHECADASGRRLAAACMDLLAATLTESGDLIASTPAATRRLQILAWIREHLRDEDLSPATIAAANHISPRYLHRLFEDHDLSVASYVRNERLDRVREDLSDALLAGRSISAIAARWGFYNQPHFTRLFRTKYGVTPGEVRRPARQRTAAGPG